MKKLIILVLLLTGLVLPQESYKGRISLVLDDELIEVPVTSIILRKEDDLILTARAEINDESRQKLITLEFIFKNDSLSDFQKEIRLTINTSDKLQNTVKELYFHYPPENEQEVFIKYSVYNKNEHLNWEISSCSIKSSAIPNFDNGRIKISGQLEGIFRSKLLSEKNTIEIKDGKFEIII